MSLTIKDSIVILKKKILTLKKYPAYRRPKNLNNKKIFGFGGTNERHGIWSCDL